MFINGRFGLMDLEYFVVCLFLFLSGFGFILKGRAITRFQQINDINIDILFTYAKIKLHNKYYHILKYESRF